MFSTCLALAHVAFVPPQLQPHSHAPPPALSRTLPPVCKGGDQVEQLVDGIADVGPNVFGTDEAVADSDLGSVITPLRIASGILMIHHGSEGGVLPANFGTPEFDGFVDYIVKPYFAFLPGEPALWSAVHDYIEFWGGAFLVVGLLTRPSSFLLCLTMVCAVYFHLASTGLQGFPLGHVENYSYNFEESRRSRIEAHPFFGSARVYLGGSYRESYCREPPRVPSNLPLELRGHRSKGVGSKCERACDGASLRMSP